MRPDTLPPREECADLPPVIKTVAETGEGVTQLCAEILGRFAADEASGALAERRHKAIVAQLKDLVGWQVADYFAERERDGRVESLARAVQDRTLDIYSAARELFSALVKGEDA
jgi:putative protein kinase ArgK-like GTPase of G3E family